MLLHDITTTEFKRRLKETKTLIVPYGTVEAHGSHLPLSTDTITVVDAVREAVRQRPAFVAPEIHYGVCTSTGQHPGSLGITPDTLRAVTRDIVRDAYSKGLRNFILISGHGGSMHLSAMREAGETLVGELAGIRLAVLMIYEPIMKEAARIIETPDDMHAGELETSLVMLLRPALVKGRGKKERHGMPKPFIVKDKVKYWPGSVDGDPTLATREKGERVFKLMVDSVVELIKKIERF
jgi:creatinine amidohydrolase